MENWGISSKGAVMGEWPKGADGEYVAPAFLEHVAGDPMTAELQRSFLNVCGIPSVCRFPSDGEFGQVMFGYSAGGVDIFVPETMLEDAKGVLSSSPEDISDDEISENNDKTDDFNKEE